mmetsp:Transcript_44587/g.110535  ORF Transcript_44587/g.110535 Transcript_44587/m.110535 type:complete len:225 (+) Transcript_44587:188-862(+)
MSACALASSASTGISRSKVRWPSRSAGGTSTPNHLSGSCCVGGARSLGACTTCSLSDETAAGPPSRVDRAASALPCATRAANMAALTVPIELGAKVIGLCTWVTCVMPSSSSYVTTLPLIDEKESSAGPRAATRPATAGKGAPALVRDSGSAAASRSGASARSIASSVASPAPPRALSRTSAVAMISVGNCCEKGAGLLNARRARASARKPFWPSSAAITCASM